MRCASGDGRGRWRTLRVPDHLRLTAQPVTGGHKRSRRPWVVHAGRGWSTCLRPGAASSRRSRLALHAELAESRAGDDSFAAAQRRVPAGAAGPEQTVARSASERGKTDPASNERHCSRTSLTTPARRAAVSEEHSPARGIDDAYQPRGPMCEPRPTTSRHWSALSRRKPNKSSAACSRARTRGGATSSPEGRSDELPGHPAIRAALHSR